MLARMDPWLLTVAGDGQLPAPIEAPCSCSANFLSREISSPKEFGGPSLDVCFLHILFPANLRITQFSKLYLVSSDIPCFSGSNKCFSFLKYNCNSCTSCSSSYEIESGNCTTKRHVPSLVELHGGEMGCRPPSPRSVSLLFTRIQPIYSQKLH